MHYASTVSQHDAIIGVGLCPSDFMVHNYSQLGPRLTCTEASTPWISSSSARVTVYQQQDSFLQWSFHFLTHSDVVWHSSPLLLVDCVLTFSQFVLKNIGKFIVIQKFLIAQKSTIFAMWCQPNKNGQSSWWDVSQHLSVADVMHSVWYHTALCSAAHAGDMGLSTNTCTLLTL